MYVRMVLLYICIHTLCWISSILCLILSYIVGFLTTSIRIVVLEIFNKSWFFLFPVVYKRIQHLFKCFFIKLTFHDTKHLVYLQLVGLCDFCTNIVSPGPNYIANSMLHILCAMLYICIYGICVHVHYVATDIHMHIHTLRHVFKEGHLPSLIFLFPPDIIMV